jgi:nucleotide-binding universal stress UspA family protein
MSQKIIVSYDGTPNDEDALALGRVLKDAGASVSLAYVRHAQMEKSERDKLDEQQADELLKRGAEQIGTPRAARHVVLNASTPNGLAELAKSEKADVIVFGSDAHTAKGSVSPQNSAQRLLDGGPVAVAIAPAGFSSRGSVKIDRIGVLAEGDRDAEETAEGLASKLGAKVTEPGERVDLFVVGSAPDARKGRLALSAAAGYAIETTSSPVIAVPRGVPLKFGRTRVLSRS